MKTVILTLIKNEHRYLEEWIRYHCELGIDTLFIIEDEGSEPHNDICSRYSNKVILKRLIDIPDIETKKQAYIFRHVYNKIIRHSAYDWCFLLDTDEFITCNNLDVLEKYANGHIHRPDMSQFDAYTKECDNRKFDIDFFKTGKMCYNCKKYEGLTYLHEHPETTRQDDIYIRHYITRSWDEWKWKLLERGMCNPGNRKLEDFFIYNPDMIQYKDILCKYL